MYYRIFKRNSSTSNRKLNSYQIKSLYYNINVAHICKWKEGKRLKRAGSIYKSQRNVITLLRVCFEGIHLIVAGI
jgi:hypothetical protein